MTNLFRRYFCRSLVMAASVLVACVSARASITVTGVVRDEAGAGLANVDIDFIDKCSGVNIYVYNDKTAFDGTFSCVIADPGTYDIRFTPPSGSTVASNEIKDRLITANTNLGTIVLHPGFTVSGVVRNTSGNGIPGVFLKFVSLATRKTVYVTKEVTTATGNYSTRVRPGTYDIEYRPPSNTTYLTARRYGVVVAADVSGLVDVLGTGLNVTGTVRDPNGVGVQNVNLDLYDVCTGRKVPTAHDSTDALGVYSVYVPSGTYTIHYNPPSCKGLGALRLPDEVVTQNRTIDVSLPSAFAVSGRVLDNVGQPVEGARIKFYAGGGRQGATNDETDAQGRFSILMAPGTYDINVEPPVGRDLVVARLSQVIVSAPIDLGDIVLAAGFPVTGVVLGPTGSGVENVNVNAVDSTTRAKVHLAHDSTAADGTFRVVVPAGTYDFQYDPPSCTGLAPTAQKAVSVYAAVTLSTVHLVSGVHAMGRVLDSAGTPVALADLDFFTPGTKDRFYTPRDTTDAAGHYDVFVQPGTYDIVYKPPKGTALRTVIRPSVVVPQDTTIADTVLPYGFIVSGFVFASSTGLPVSGVLVDFYSPGSTAPLLTSYNTSAADGSYAVVVDAGTWDILYTPPPGSGLAPRYRRGVVVAGDDTVPDTLLLPLTVPSVLSVSPPSGTTAGGQTVTVGGNDFQPDATVQMGGVEATNVVVASATSLTCTSPPHPAGLVGVTVTNPGHQVSITNGSYTYAEPPGGGVQLRVARVGSDIVLTWGSTGQSGYTVFRNTSPTGFTGDSILGTTPGTTYTDQGATSGSAAFYYQVD